MNNLINQWIIKYYYDFILQSSLTSLTFPTKSGKVKANELNDINYFLLKDGETDEKTYKDSFECLSTHIDSLDVKSKKKYKIIYFPFIDEFVEISKYREDRVYTTPIYFIFNIEEDFKEIFESLKNLSVNNRETDLVSIFENAQIVFNNYYASNKLYIINHNALQEFKGEFEKKDYPKKDFEYYISILKSYIETSNLKDVDKDSFIDIVNLFNEQLKRKINPNKNLNSFVDSEINSLIGVVNVEKLLEQDNITRGLLSAYNSSIIPYFKDIDPNDKLNRILFYHPSQYLKRIEIASNENNGLNLSIDRLKELQINHLGSFNSKFSITPSQRLALSSYISPMDIIPVNGPPGTGKTALLRAIFADYIVKSAFKAKKSYDDVKKDPYSFIDTQKPILGTSSVRQAINNIIEGISGGFGEAKENNSMLHQRWLSLKNFEADVEVDLIKENCVVPQIRNRENKYENNVLFTSISKIFDYISSIDVTKAENDFLKKLNSTFTTKIDNLDDAVNFLYDDISSRSKDISSEIDNSSDEELFSLYEQLDTTKRYDNFFTSLHLLELFFIINIKRLNKKASNGKCPLCDNVIEDTDYCFECSACDFKIYKNDKYRDISIETKDDLKALLDNNLEQNDKFYGIKYYDGGYCVVEQDKSTSDLSSDINNIYLITPLFPMVTVTMHSLFGAFKHKVDGKNILIREFFDLVLSDESGMVLAPVALPALYVAKKMVIVGDEKQIEPVYPFDEIIDNSIVSNISSEIDYSKFKKSNSAIYSNFLTIANKATNFNSYEMQEHENNSLWLKEHFRCKDEIIEYCNEIIYKGILIPKVRTIKKEQYLDDAKEKYPSIKLFDIKSGVKNNSSYLEASKIVEYLLNNIDSLTEIYNKYNNKDVTTDQFYKHIGIVTPFNNQKKMISNELRKAKEFNLDKILVGTVHAFQGSEREIIIFSPTVDANYNGTHFINKDDGNMMNVAVSRAKSAFWVFGSKNGLKNAGDYTKQLVEYIATNNKCEIVCPLCNGCLVEDDKFFKCENYRWNPKTKDIDGCNFMIWKNNKSINSTITQDILKSLLLNKSLKVQDKEYILDLESKYFIKPIVKKKVVSDTKECPKCGASLKEKSGKFGKFYGCSKFPNCKYTEKIN